MKMATSGAEFRHMPGFAVHPKPKAVAQSFGLSLNVILGFPPLLASREDAFDRGDRVACVQAWFTMPEASSIAISTPNLLRQVPTMSTPRVVTRKGLTSSILYPFDDHLRHQQGG